MSNATKCQNCGKFEEGLGYSVRIYQRVESKDPKGNLREKVNKLVARDYLCYECASDVANVLHETLIPD